MRDLRGVVEREKAQIGVLLTMQEPTAPMRKETASAGFYESPGWHTKHPRALKKWPKTARLSSAM